MNKSQKAALMQCLELVVAMAIVACLAWVFGVHSELAKGAAIALVGALATFLRVHPASPVPDYVNE